MNKIFAVIRREFLARVKTKMFLIGTLLFPVLMIGMIVLSALLMTGTSRTTRIAIVDAAPGVLGERVEAALAAETFRKDDVDSPTYEIERVVVTGNAQAVEDSLVAMTGFSKRDNPESFDGVLIVDEGTTVTGQARYLGSNAGSIERMQELRSDLSKVLISSRLADAGVDEGTVMRALIPARLETSRVSNGVATGESGEASFLLGYLMGIILYMAILIYGQQTALSVIEEKTSRIMEVLASSLTPFEMLLGKIVGVGSAGLLQLSIWGAAMFVGTTQRGAIAELFGADPNAVMSLPIPEVPLDLVVVFLTYFALGFLLYGALFAAIGSMVNAMQEMQQMMMPVTLVIVSGFLGMFAVLNDPNSTLGVVFSMIPFFSPFVMPVRWSMASVPVVELLLSVTIMVIGVIAVAWVAGRIYRIGILMYGKKPSFREIGRWLTAK